MFFVSEEFLRQMEQGGQPASTLGEAVDEGQPLFTPGAKRPDKSAGRTAPQGGESA